MVKPRSRPALLECLEFPLQRDEQDSSWRGGFTIGEDNPCGFLRDVVHGDSRLTVCSPLWFILVFIKGPITRSSGDLGQSCCLHCCRFPNCIYASVYLIGLLWAGKLIGDKTDKDANQVVQGSESFQSFYFLEFPPFGNFTTVWITRWNWAIISDSQWPF